MKFEFGSSGDNVERHILRRYFKTYMGPAMVIEEGEERHLEFRPRRLAEAWLEHRRAGADRRPAY